MANFERIGRPDPRTKREFIDRLMSYDFDGDIKALGKTPATIQRTGENEVAITFPDSGRTYLMSIHIPRVGVMKAKSEIRSLEPAKGSEEREEWEKEPRSKKPYVKPVITRRGQL